MGAIPTSTILSRKGIARYGGVSRTGLLRIHSFRVEALCAVNGQGEPCFSSHALVKAMCEAPKCLQSSCFEASKLASTNALLLKQTILALSSPL